MPTLEVQLAKAQTSLAALEDSMNVNPSMLYLFRRRRADQYHDKDAELRGLRERVRHLQQRIAERNERDELHATAEALMRLAQQWVQTYETVDLPTHTSVSTAPS
jgi:Skp family chaperone for outer membrane proteins